ncbi:MAG: sporulation protein YqfD [Eubacterium sp.]|nr:sporulation protein YqfD [Eubacterium sp.]
MNGIWDGIECSMNQMHRERFMNICRHRGMNLYHSSLRRDMFVFRMRGKDYKKLREVSRKIKSHPHIEKKTGIVFGWFYILKHLSYFTGLLLFVCLLQFLSGFVWKIEYEGNYRYTEETLQRALNDMGVKKGLSRKKLVCEQIEKQMRKQFDDISWVSAEECGSVLKVAIKEKKETSMPQEGKTGDLRSPCEGKVTSLVVEQGQAAVKIGDHVKKNQILVYGKVIITNDDDQIVEERSVQAKALYKIQGSEKIRYKIACKGKRKVYTGEEKSVYSISGNGKTLNLANPLKRFDKSLKYDIMTTVCTEKEIPFGDAEFTVRKKVFLPYTLKDHTYTQKEVEKLVQKEVERKLLLLQRQQYEIRGKTWHITKQADDWVAEGTIQFAKEENHGEQGNSP